MIDFDQLNTELSKRKIDFDWSFKDNEKTAKVQLGEIGIYDVSLEDPIAAEWIRKTHENNRGMEPAVCLILETAIDLFRCESFLDIGTHYGFLSLFVGQNPAINAVHSVEMNPDVADIYKSNLDLNPTCKDKTTVHNVGLSDENIENLKIWYHGMRLLFDEPHNKKIPSTEIDILTFSTLIDKIGYLPDLIKIDIEGFEAKLVDDLRAMDTSVKKPVILMEVHGEELINRLGSNRHDIFDAILGHDYNCAQLNWHQHMPGGALLRSITKDDLVEAFKKPHASYLFW